MTEQAFLALDTDGSGEIDYSEFLAARRNLRVTVAVVVDCGQAGGRGVGVVSQCYQTFVSSAWYTEPRH